MIKEIKKLTVKYHGRTVGYLAEVERGIAFQYDDEWLKDGFSISPFSLPLKEEVYINRKETFGGLYGVFQDTLPDGWGELLVRRMLAKQGINPDRLSPLSRLSLISGSGLGALTYEPCQNEEDDAGEIDFDFLAQEAEKVLDDMSVDVDLDRLYRLGASSGGARPKAHIQDGDDFWIVKFPSSLDPRNIGEQEYRANQIARACGIEVAEFKLFPSKLCTGYFGSKRFDRTPNGRVHTVSLSSLLETSHRIPNLDYIHLFQVISAICADKHDLMEAFRRMCFNVFYKNKDDHGKNFSFLYDKRLGGYKLSPAYDLTQTKNKAEHEMAVNGSGNPTEQEIMEVAKIIKLSLAECKRTMEGIKALTQL